MSPVPLRPADEPARREGRQQRVRTEAVRLQHGVRARRIHQPAGNRLQIHNREVTRQWLRSAAIEPCDGDAVYACVGTFYARIGILTLALAFLRSC